jgi:DNA repair protein RadC
MGITDWPEGERPRERLHKFGPEALSDAELLAIFLRVGTRGKSAVDLARELLALFDNNLANLMSAPVSKLSKVTGIGQAKAAQLTATLEIARRAIVSRVADRSIFTSPREVREWLQLRLAGLQHEVFMALWLDSGNRLISFEELFRGSISHTVIHPREVVKSALSHNAAAVVIAHNHPSGRIEPSTADIKLTIQLKQALELVDVRLIDHFVVATGHSPRSMAEQGLI